MYPARSEKESEIFGLKRSTARDCKVVIWKLRIETLILMLWPNVQIKGRLFVFRYTYGTIEIVEQIQPFIHCIYFLENQCSSQKHFFFIIRYNLIRNIYSQKFVLVLSFPFSLYLNKYLKLIKQLFYKLIYKCFVFFKLLNITSNERIYLQLKVKNRNFFVKIIWYTEIF